MEFERREAISGSPVATLGSEDLAPERKPWTARELYREVSRRPPGASRRGCQRGEIAAMER